MDLQTIWFCLIAFLWSAYFVLEGFDFGVGMLLPFLPRDEFLTNMIVTPVHSD